ncbi:DNA-binding domain-containing protein, AraC-type [Polaromonas sp. CF318]|uniref:helix-turn-helix domain-containing protein n=1 Tax=Polaromonas sp. CF318 TaxID=1144318 RepID=UPI0002711849|nr:AraC family transcriptional regulator [Polaromonas sp. CF318]EJL77847.1 DNA-binding domain-containing protein, AraC-type [Polaromonas sp. CF318]
MPASPLTDETWPGLPLLQCNMDPGLYELYVDTPMLVFRDDVGSRVETADGEGHCVEFRQAPLRFDLFARGVRMNAVSDRVATISLVVALPPGWLPADDEGVAGRFGLRSLYQFADNDLKRLVRRLTACHRSGEPLGSEYSEAISRTLVDRVVRLQLAADARQPDSAGLDLQAREWLETFVDANLQEPPAAAAMAAALGMGVVRFSRAFKMTFSATPHQYIQARRLKRARELLCRTDAPLTTIALDTGFASHAHFSAVFRATTGLTPSSYRRVAAE